MGVRRNYILKPLVQQQPGTVMLPQTSRLKYLYLAYFSKPAGERALYRLISRRRPRRILELGIGSGRRAVRMLQTCRRWHGCEELRYVGVDLFEARPASAVPPLSLKQAHCLLKATGAKIHLIPGDPLSALARSANSLPGNDLVIISADQPPESLAQSWFYLPRMLSPGSIVLLEAAAAAATPAAFRTIEAAEIEALAAVHMRRRAA